MPTPTYLPPWVTQPPDNTPEPKRPSRGKILTIIGLVAALVAIIVTVLITRASPPAKAPGPPSAQIVASSIVGDQAQGGATVKAAMPTGPVTVDNADDWSVPVEITFSDGTQLAGVATSYANGSNAYTLNSP